MCLTPIPFARSFNYHLYSKSAISIADKIILALTQPDTIMVGVYGSSNIRRCNVLKLITRRVERDGLFDVVVMTSVLRKKTWWWRWIKSPDVKRIQEELGNELGVQFHDKTRMEERASSLAERIKMEEKILIVTNVFCGGINFEKIGIPFGNDHKGCKIMLVAKSIEMLSNKMHPKGYLSCKPIFEVDDNIDIES